MAKINIVVDEYADTVTINGVKFHSEALEALASTPVGEWIRINGRNKCGTVTVQCVQAGTALAKQFDTLAGMDAP